MKLPAYVILLLAVCLQAFPAPPPKKMDVRGIVYNEADQLLAGVSVILSSHSTPFLTFANR
jgi:hypothetical protein